MTLSKVYNLTTLVLISMTFVFEMSTDLYIASLPEMATFFQVDEGTSQLTLSAYLLGFALLGGVSGALSDAVGRRPLLLTGMACFFCASLLCWFAPTMTSLISSRFLQGIGAGIAIVIVPAIIKDNNTESDCSLIFSAMGMIIAMSPTIAPILGAKIADVWGWPSCFLTITLLSGALAVLGIGAVRESLDPQLRGAFSAQNTVRTFRKLITRRETIGYVLISGIIYGGLWAWITAAPFFMINTMGMSRYSYGLYASLGPIAYIFGSYLNQRLVKEYGVQRMLAFGIYVMTAGALFALSVIYLFPVNITVIYGILMIYAIGLAPVWANSTTKAVDVAPHQRGSASAVLTTFEMIFGSLFAYGVSLFETKTLLPAISLIVTASFVAMGLYYWVAPKTQEVKV